MGFITSDSSEKFLKFQFFNWADFFGFQCVLELCFVRCTPSEVCRREIRNEEERSLSELRVDLSTSSNFMDLDWILPSESGSDDIHPR